MKNCEYCTAETDLAIETDSGPVPVCGKCAALLSSPRTGPRLIRGHLTMRLRGTMRPEALEGMLARAMPVLETARKPAAD
jgi:hypothetical protein